MDDKEQLGNKTCGDGVHIVKDRDLAKPIKQVYLLEGKHFIVIDRSITQKLNFFDYQNKEMFFQQEVTEDGCIILRPFKMSE